MTKDTIAETAALNALLSEAADNQILAEMLGFVAGRLMALDVDLPSAVVCRKHGISTASFYKYKWKFGGMDVSDARKLKALEYENAKLKKLLAEQMLDNAILKDVNSKKW